MQRHGIFFQSRFMKKSSRSALEERKSNLEKRLHLFELENTIADLSAFETAQYNFVDAIEAGERMFILLATAFAAYNFDQAERIMDWLKKEDLWSSTSQREKQFFRDPDPSEEELQTLSWRFEGAYILAWSLGKVDSASPDSELSEREIEDFLKHVPAIGSEIDAFFEELEFRSLQEVVDESLFYQNVTTYFKNIATEHKENTSPVHAKAANERDKALKWLSDGDQQLW